MRYATRRPSVQARRTVDLVAPLFTWLKLGDEARGYRALRAFAHACGPRIRAHARAERLRGAILYVRVSSSPWAHQLHALKAQLLDKLRATAGGEGVTDLHFKVGPLDELPAWDPPRRAAAPASEPPAKVDPRVEEAVAGVADPELREAFGLLARKMAR